MTLCIAKRLNSRNVELASDSRFTLKYGNEEKYFDTGIKVMSLTCTIHLPYNYLEDKEESELRTYGLAVAGDTLHTYLVKEAIQELLNNIVLTSIETVIKVESICDLICKVFGKLAYDVSSARNTLLNSGFFFVGYCLESRRVKAFRFKVSRSPHGFVGGKYEEILYSDGDTEFIGSGEDFGRQVHKEHPKWPPSIILVFILELVLSAIMKRTKMVPYNQKCNLEELTTLRKT